MIYNAPRGGGGNIHTTQVKKSAYGTVVDCTALCCACNLLWQVLDAPQGCKPERQGTDPTLPTSPLSAAGVEAERLQHSLALLHVLLVLVPLLVVAGVAAQYYW